MPQQFDYPLPFKLIYIIVYCFFISVNDCGKGSGIDGCSLISGGEGVYRSIQLLQWFVFNFSPRIFICLYVTTAAISCSSHV